MPFTSFAVSEQAFNDWYRNTSNVSHRILLIEAYHTGGIVRMSDRGYIANDINAPFPAWLLHDGLPEFTRRIEKPISVSEFKAVCDVRDWRGYSFDNQPCKIYFGDDRWDFSFFKQIANLTIDSVSYNAGVYSFRLTEGREAKIELLQDVSEGERKMKVYGRLTHVKPQLVDAFTLDYRFHDGNFNGNITVYDIGLDVTGHVTRTQGNYKYNAGHNPAGAQLVDVDSNTKKLEDVVNQINTEYSLNGVDVSSLAQWKKDAVIGFAVRGTETASEILDKIARSVGVFLVRKPEGGWMFIDATPVVNILRINDDNSTADISVSNVLKPVSKVIVNYGGNVDVLSDSNLAISLTAEQRAEFTSGKKTVEKVTGAVGDVLEINTVLQNQADAQALADMIALRRATKRVTYEFGIDDLGHMIIPGMPVSVNRSDLSGNFIVSSIKSRTDTSIHNIEVF